MVEQFCLCSSATLGLRESNYPTRIRSNACRRPIIGRGSSEVSGVRQLASPLSAPAIFQPKPVNL